MPNNVIAQVLRGSGKARQGTLHDAAGRALTGAYDGSEPLAAEVWSGDERAVLFAPSVTWLVAASGTFNISFAAADTDLDPGLYPVILDVDGERQRAGFLEILASPGDEAPPIVYGTYDGVLRRAGEWLARMQGVSSQSRFAEELHEAVDWTHRQVMSRVRSYLERRAGGYLGDPEGIDLLDAVSDATGDTDAALMDARLAIVGDALETGTALILTPTIIKANEHYAASILLGHIMPSKDGADFPRMAAYHRSRANQLLSACTFAVDTDDDGAAEFSLPPI